MNFAVLTMTDGFLIEDMCVRPKGMVIQSCAVECL